MTRRNRVIAIAVLAADADRLGRGRGAGSSPPTCRAGSPHHRAQPIGASSRPAG